MLPAPTLESIVCHYLFGLLFLAGSPWAACRLEVMLFHGCLNLWHVMPWPIGCLAWYGGLVMAMLLLIFAFVGIAFGCQLLARGHGLSLRYYR